MSLHTCLRGEYGEDSVDTLQTLQTQTFQLLVPFYMKMSHDNLPFEMVIYLNILLRYLYNYLNGLICNPNIREPIEAQASF